jgi:hypothetical protein
VQVVLSEDAPVDEWARIERAGARVGIALKSNMLGDVRLAALGEARSPVVYLRAPIEQVHLEALRRLKNFRPVLRAAAVDDGVVARMEQLGPVRGTVWIAPGGASPLLEGLRQAESLLELSAAPTRDEVALLDRLRAGRRAVEVKLEHADAAMDALALVGRYTLILQTPLGRLPDALVARLRRASAPVPIVRALGGLADDAIAALTLLNPAEVIVWIPAETSAKKWLPAVKTLVEGPSPAPPRFSAPLCRGDADCPLGERCVESRRPGPSRVCKPW